MDNTVHDAQRLKELQALPLDRKIQITQNRIQEWYMHYNGNVYVSFSGGKDSTVLATLAKQIFPDIPLVFANTGLEFSSIQKFAKESGAVQVYPEMQFKEVISTYGYPIISKEVADCIYYSRNIKHNSGDTMMQKRQLLMGTCINKNTGEKSLFNKKKWLEAAQELPFPISHLCCNIMKKKTMKKYGKETGNKPIIATLADESRVRKKSWIQHGCNAFDSSSPSSQPMSFWTEQDVLTFIKESNIKISDVYGDICLDDKKNLL